MSMNKVGIGLSHRMGSLRDYDSVDVNIFMKGEHPSELTAIRTAASVVDDTVAETASPMDVVVQLRERCQQEQREVIDLLHASRQSIAFTDEMTETVDVGPSVTSFWINNAVGATVSPSIVEKLLARDDVMYIEVARYADLEELIDAKKKSVKKTGKKTGKKASKKKRVSKPAALRTLSALMGMAVNASGGLISDDATDEPHTAWSVERVNAPKLWRAGVNGKGVVVAVIDTGVNYNHPDLKARMWRGGPSFPKHGYNFAENNNDPMDQQGHGTACAGQVAGTGKMGTLTGVAPGSTVMAIRVGGAERNFWEGMQFAITQGAHVISMSMSWKYPSSPNYPGWRRVCESLLASSILHANSIGNQGRELSRFPVPYNIATPGNCPPPRMHPLQQPVGGLSSAISCGATDDLDQLADYSGRGPAAWEVSSYTDYPYASGTKPGLIKPDVCAPGPGTMSCNWRFSGTGSSANPYRTFGGTSAATPHVGGCLSLLAQACLAAGQPIVPARVQEALENTAVRVAGQSLDKENHYGAGRVDVYAAYKYGKSRGWW